MKDVCLCVFNYPKKNRLDSKIHSIGINDGKGYYSKEAGGYLNVDHEKLLFKYKELSWKEFRLLIDNGLQICSCDKPKHSGYWGDLWECQNCKKPSMAD